METEKKEFSRIFMLFPNWKRSGCRWIIECSNSDYQKRDNV